MIYPGFCAPSNQSQSVVANSERLVNLYAERLQSRFAPVESALYPTPGRRAFATAALDVGGRELFTAAGRAFAVIGGWFHEVTAVGTTTRIFAVAQDNYPAQMAYNSASGGQIVVASGTNAYHYNLTTGANSKVLTGECTMIAMTGNRFLSFNIVTGQVRLSAANDGTTWTAQVFANSVTADRWQAMVVRDPEICLLGETSLQFWYNSGATPQPFALNTGSVFPSGTCAPFSARLVGDAIVWVQGTKDGVGRIMRAQGYSPEPISNYAVETAISGYARAGSIADAETLSYELEAGHPFAVFSFPSGGTWVIDLETGAWHEQLTWNSVQNRYTPWGPRVHCVAFNKHLVADRTSGIISALDVTIGDDLGAPIRRLRAGPPIYASSRQQIVVNRFDLLLEAGLGTGSGQGANPTVMFRSSKNGKTWSTERQMAAGPMGAYGTRCYTTMLGSSEKLWCPEITMSDPAIWRIVGAEIEGSGFRQTRAA